MRALSIHVLLLLLILLWAPSIGSCQGQAGGASNIIGLLHVEGGEFPAGHVEVLLESNGIQAMTTYADEEGRFAFNGLITGEYHVVIQDPAYVSVERTVTIDSLFPQTITLSFYLVPRESSNASTEAPATPGPDGRMMRASGSGGAPSQPQRGANPYLVSPQELGRNYPHEAVKEFEKGGESRRKGKLDEAIKHYEKAIKLAPDFYAAQNDLGTAYLEKHDFAEAEQEFEGVMKSNPSDPDAYFNLANADLLTGNFQQGLDYVNQGLAKQPNAALGLFVQGSLYRRLGDFAHAEHSLRDALQADPTLANAHLELVNLYREQENRGAMVSELQAFLKLYPKNAFVPQVKSALEKLSAPSAAASH